MESGYRLGCQAISNRSNDRAGDRGGTLNLPAPERRALEVVSGVPPVMNSKGSTARCVPDRDGGVHHREEDEAQECPSGDRQAEQAPAELRALTAPMEGFGQDVPERIGLQHIREPRSAFRHLVLR
jgi:hypothetical protein